MTIDVNDPNVVEAIKSAGFLPKDEIESVVSERNSALEATKNSILDQLNTVKQTYKGIDAEAYRKLEEDARFKRILSEGLDGYERSLGGELQERLSAQQSDFMIKEQDFLRQLQDAESKTGELEQSLNQSEIKRKLGMAIAHNDLVDPLAIAEIERDAMDELALDDKGNIVVMGADGIPQQTAEGPKREKEWLNEMMTSKPYRFKGANGGGNRRVDGLGGVDLDKLSPAEKRRLGRKSSGR